MKVVERGSGRDTEDTNTGKSNRYPNFHSKTTTRFSLTIVFYRVEKERKVGTKSRFGKEEQLRRLCILSVDRESSLMLASLIRR